MSKQPADLGSELDSFRQQWLSDLRTRKGDTAAQPATAASASVTASTTSFGTEATSRRRHSKGAKQSTPSSPTSSRRQNAHVDTHDGGDDYLQHHAFDEPPTSAGYTLDGSTRPAPDRTLVSALDHYEEAMEKEAQGNLGESLKLYRQAYRLDNRVDKRYREKHFPSTTAAPLTKVQPKAASSLPQPPNVKGKTIATSPTTTKSTIATAPVDEAAPQPIKIVDLIASFSNLSIVPSPPEVENTPPPPCPIADLPSELLVHILSDIAAADPGAFVAVALACKRFAFLVATEQRIWRRAALSTDFGFPAMHYRFDRTVEWGELEEVADDEAGGLDLELDFDLGGDDAVPTDPKSLSDPWKMQQHRRRRILRKRHQAEIARETVTLVPSIYASWRDMFRTRPRIRFNGCYISTVNYIRSGQMSTNQATWGGSPIHIVTYYRYLRFFRDGTVISLLSTSEPRDVVHNLTRDQLRHLRDRDGRPDHHPHPHHHAHQQPQQPPSALPSTAMRDAHRGRWHLVPAESPSAADDAQGPEGDLFVETEGPNPRYMLRMALALRSAGRGARNNKLAWRGFHSYNKLTDDWSEFELKHDKQFFFSRVRSYGMGE
ncbi:hypothetical protein HIM_08986 [Hirsutella minnesotensis 3608]|uniref:F-box domain-containing protein n=1 Tax=Hirsutella minnesotensis 3608 TaxID=1043627 RepID=A0A0F7ZXZ7_9HYPO|nr:hypothetical protein HIM_08986 [Hirsutella minnesotensis 3608]